MNYGVPHKIIDISGVVSQNQMCGVPLICGGPLATQSSDDVLINTGTSMNVLSSLGVTQKPQNPSNLHGQQRLQSSATVINLGIGTSAEVTHSNTLSLLNTPALNQVDLKKSTV